MIKTIIGAFVGFFVWSALWIGSDFVIKAVAPSLYPSDDLSTVQSSYLILKIVLSVFFSVVSGYLSAVVANDSRQSPFVLGIVLFFFGLGVQVTVWNRIPVWYHFVFLLLLLPMTVLGGRLRR